MEREKSIFAGQELPYGVVYRPNHWDEKIILRNRDGCAVVEKRTDLPKGKKPKKSIRNNKDGSRFHRVKKIHGQAPKVGLESSLLTSAVQTPNKPAMAEKPKGSRENQEGRLRPRGK